VQRSSASGCYLAAVESAIRLRLRSRRCGESIQTDPRNSSEYQCRAKPETGTRMFAHIFGGGLDPLMFTVRARGDHGPAVRSNFDRLRNSHELAYFLTIKAQMALTVAQYPLRDLALLLSNWTITGTDRDAAPSIRPGKRLSCTPASGRQVAAGDRQSVCADVAAD